MLIATESVAQLFVKEKTIFSIRTPVSSLGQSNVFHANVTGNSTLHLIGKKQTWAIAKNAYLTNVSIDNASKLRMIIKINIKGNLDIRSGVLVLEHPLIIGGKLLAFNKATVQNACFITFIQHHIAPLNVLFSSCSQVEVANFSKSQKGLNNVIFIKKYCVSHYVAAFYQRYSAAPTILPLENS